MGLSVIVTGTTGMVGEGVLLECLQNPAVDRVLAVSRRTAGHTHPKLTELLVPDFTQLQPFEAQLSGYDACFYCAGISSAGMSEAEYTKVTYDTPVAFATVLARLNPKMVLCHVSGAHTDSSEQGRIMWARVKGKAENALLRLPFRRVANFRPGFMEPVKGQHNIKTLFRVALVLTPLFKLFFPSLTLNQVGQAMIKSASVPELKPVLEVADIKALAAS